MIINRLNFDGKCSIISPLLSGINSANDGTIIVPLDSQLIIEHLNENHHLLFTTGLDFSGSCGDERQRIWADMTIDWHYYLTPETQLFPINKSVNIFTLPALITSKQFDIIICSFSTQLTDNIEDYERIFNILRSILTNDGFIFMTIHDAEYILEQPRPEPQTTWQTLSRQIYLAGLVVCRREQQAPSESAERPGYQQVIIKKERL